MQSQGRPGLQRRQRRRVPGHHRTINQFAAQGQAEMNQLVQELKPSCAPPKDCAQAANWANNELKTLQQFGNQVWASSASGAVSPTVGLEALVGPGVGAAARLAAGGFVVGAGFDAAGQYVQSGTVRPEQSLVAGVTGAVGVSLAARGNLWIPAAGAGAAAVNTSFNNLYYGEETSVFWAAVLGAGAATFAPFAGGAATKLSSPLFSSSARIPIKGPTPVFPAHGTLNPIPKQIGSVVETGVSNMPSFIPLDNGKKGAKQ